MHRSFALTLPTHGVAVNLLTAILATPNAVPADTILPKLVSGLQIQMPLVDKTGAQIVANAGAHVTITDSNSLGGQILSTADVFAEERVLNSVYLGSYYLIPDTDGVVVNVDISSR